MSVFSTIFRFELRDLSVSTCERPIHPFLRLTDRRQGRFYLTVGLAGQADCLIDSNAHCRDAAMLRFSKYSSE
jgi:hypothetical protein